MSTKYEKIYAHERHALGPPTKEFMPFFERYSKRRAHIFDLGCGQGRDALFIARRGHGVVGVDISPSGIRDLLEDAKAEDLNVEGIVADIRDFRPTGRFDVIVIDRTLHMLSEYERVKVLGAQLLCIAEDGFLLIADEKSNIPSFKDVLARAPGQWEIQLERRGFLFAQRRPSN